MGEERPFWGRKSFLLVTGASQGIGRQIALEFSKRVDASGSTVVLLARSKQKLEGVRDAIASTTPGLEVIVEVQDLSKPDLNQMEALFKRVSETGRKFESWMLVHNAGSEGSGALTSEISDLKEWQDYMSLNVYSMAMLTSCFLKWADPGASSRFILNVTSLAAIQPIKGLGIYCVGKSAREMYLRTLAEENPSLDILNYSPGAVGTEMVDRVIENTKDKGTREVFVGMKERGKLVKVEDTVANLANILSFEGKYKSGGRIDYFNRQ